MSGPLDLYSPAPDLVVGVTGAAGARAHLAREYGAARAAGGPPDVVVDVRFAARLPPVAARDGHKTVRWSVELGSPDECPLRLRLTVAGRPRQFALSMLQGFVIEPVVSVAAARKGLVLLPAAGLVDAGRGVVVLGRSGSGKTSVVARAVAAGRSALGDDQVIVDATGQVRSWPRRLRVYADLARTAPAAVAALPPARRRALSGRRWLKALSGGWVGPSLPLAWADVGAPAEPGPLPIARVVVVERGGGGAGIDVQPLALADVADLARTILAEQRSRLGAVAGAAWRTAFDEAADLEERTLRRGLADVPAERWRVPATWDAPRAVDALSAALGG